MFICSFNKYLLNIYYVPGTGQGTWNTAVNKAVWNFHPPGAHSKVFKKTIGLQGQQAIEKTKIQNKRVLIPNPSSASSYSYEHSANYLTF